MKISLKLRILGALIPCIISGVVGASATSIHRDFLHLPSTITSSNSFIFSTSTANNLFTNLAAPAATITSTGTGGDWNNPATWAGGVVPVAGDDVIIADGTTVTIDINTEVLNSLTIGQTGSAILQFESTTARIITVNGNVTVNPTSFFRSAEAGSTSEIKTHSLVVGGNLINKGTINFSATAGLGGTTLNASGAGITFTGIGNAEFNCSAATSTNLRQVNGVNLNKGTDKTPILSFIPGGVFNVLSANSVGFLNIKNGTFKIEGTNIFSNPVFNNNASDTIPVSGGFWLANPDAIIVGMSGTLLNQGEIKITAGIFNIGNSSGNSSVTSSDGKFTLSGGTMNIAGRFKISGGECTINGGTMNIATVGHAANNEGAFHITTTAKLLIENDPLITFTQSNSHLTDPFNDIEIVGTTDKTITGGTFQIGTISTLPGSTFLINSSIPFFNLVVNNESGNNPSIELVDKDLIVSNTLTMAAGNIDTNGKKVILTKPNINSLDNSSGFIDGTLERAIGTGSAYLFPILNSTGDETPLILNFSGQNSTGTITVTSIAGADLTGSLLNSSQIVPNHWEINNSGVTFTSMGGNLTFPEVSPTAGPYKLGIYDGAGWSYPSVTTSTTTSISFTGANLSSNNVSFSLAECTPPTITLDTSPVVCEGTTSTSIAYTATTNSPEDFRIDYTDASFTDVDWISIEGSSFPITIPLATAPATYNATLYVRNESSCESAGVPFSITINPQPVATNGTAATCSDVAFNYNLQTQITNSITSSFTWTVADNTNVTGEADGSGDFITQTLTNISSSAQNVVYTVTPTNESNGCHGNDFTVTLTINPTPTPPSSTNQTICYNTSTVLTAGGAVSGQVYKWYDAAVGGNLIKTSSDHNDVNYTSSSLTASTSYWITITNNSTGCESTRTKVDVTVQLLLAGGTIAADQTICEGDSPVLTGDAVTSGSATISYQWESSLNGTSGWNAISGATGQNYTSAPLNADTWFRRIVSSTLNANSCTTASNIVRVTVNNLSPGTLSADQEICLGASPLPITSASAATGDGAITYKWQLGTESATGTFTDISPAVTTANYTPPSPPVTTWYRRVAISTLNGVACSKYVTHELYVGIYDPGTITASDAGSNPSLNYCYGTNPGIINGTDQSGAYTPPITLNSYRWQYSTTSESSGFTDIVPAATNASYDPPAITVTTWYRRIVRVKLKSNYCENPGNVIKMTVLPLPVPTISGPPTACSSSTGNVYTTEAGMTGYTWGVSPGGTITAGAGTNTITVSWNLAGTQTVDVKYTNASGCTNTNPTVRNVTVNQKPTVLITNPAAVCYPSTTVDLTAAAVTSGSTPGLTFAYFTDAAGTIPLANANAVSVSGTYYIRGTTTPAGCDSDIKAVVVTVNPKPTVVINQPAAVCSPATVNLTTTIDASSTPGLTYTYWTNASATTSFSNYTTAGAGTYYIKGTVSATGCYDIQPVTVIVNPTPSVVAPTPSTKAICTGGSTAITLTATTGITVTFA